MHACVRLLSAADTWQYRGAARFGFPNGGYRSQGAVWDGRHWFFSWRYGLEETDAELGRYHDLHDGQEHEMEGLAVVEDGSATHLDVLLRHGSLQQPFGAAMLFLQFDRITN